MFIIPIYLFSEIFPVVSRGPMCSSCTREHSPVWPPLLKTDRFTNYRLPVLLLISWFSAEHTKRYGRNHWGGWGVAPPPQKKTGRTPNFLRSFLGGGNRLRQTGYTFLFFWRRAVLPGPRNWTPQLWKRAAPPLNTHEASDIRVWLLVSNRLRVCPESGQQLSNQITFTVRYDTIRDAILTCARKPT